MPAGEKADRNFLRLARFGPIMTEHRHSYAYLRLLVMTVLSFLAMYILMYAMVNRLADVYANLNQAYMAALMVCPMVVIELWLMRGMYANRAANLAIVVASILVFAAAWAMTRQQTAIGDEQFLRSMIPHHSGAVLMCEQAPIEDAEIRDLCGTIIPGQQAEIDQMKAILARVRAE